MYGLRRQPGFRARFGVVVGLLFLGGPLSDLLAKDLGTARLVAILVGTALFVALYLLLLPPSRWVTRFGPRAIPLLLGAMPLIAVVLLAGGAPRSYAALFVYFAVAVGLLLPSTAAVAIIGTTAAAVGSPPRSGVSTAARSPRPC